MGRGIIADVMNIFSKKQIFRKGFQLEGQLVDLRKISEVDFGAISVRHDRINVNSSTLNSRLTLADGKEGQEITIFCTALDTAAVITPDNLLGYTTITFNAVADSVGMKFIDGNWVILSGHSYVVA